MTGTEDELQELYLNGIASVKGGNRRLGQAFFKKVIRVNPRHEGAWLWLSEVLDEPEDIAYCLEAVLAINPGNEKARMALEIVQQERTGPRRPREWSPLADLMDLELPAILAETPAPLLPPPPPVEPSPRRLRLGPLLRAGLFATSVLAVLTVSIYWSVQPSPGNPGLSAEVPAPTGTSNQVSLEHEEMEQVRAYFAQIDVFLGTLRLAHDIYRGQHEQRLSLPDQMASATVLRARVEEALAGLQALDPPEPLAGAHREYVQGLSLELEGLDNLVEYYETSQAGFSNRAIVRLQEAGIHLERAKATWRAFREWVGFAEPTRIPTPTPRTTPTHGPSPTPVPTAPPRPTFTPTSFPTRSIGQSYRTANS